MLTPDVALTIAARLLGGTPASSVSYLSRIITQLETEADCRYAGLMGDRRRLDEVVADYIAAVGCRDPQQRGELIAASVSEAFVFCSGSGEFHGRGGFFDAIDGVQALVPKGAVLTRATPIEEHHGRVRFGWCFEDSATGRSFDDQPFGGFLRGMDFATLDDAGLLSSVTVFYEAGLTGDDTAS